MDTEITLARHDERISDLEEWRKSQGKTLERINQKLEEIEKDYANRPTWTVALMLSMLSTATGTMAIYIITNL